MKRLFCAASAAVVTFCLAAASFAAPGLTSVTPDGTVGTQLTIVGTELGTKAPKAVLQLHGSTAKPFALKLSKPFDGTTLHATVVKVTPGVYDVVVTPKGGSPLTLSSAFTAHAPEVASLSVGTASPGDHVDILGAYFGIKKCKVLVGGVAEKITSWSDVKITVVVSKKNKAGSGPITVICAGGSFTGKLIDVVMPPDPNAFHFTMNFDQGGPQFTTDKLHSYALQNPGPSFLLHGETTVGGSLHTVSIGGAGTMTSGATILGDMIGASYLEDGASPLTYTSDGTAGSFSVTFVTVSSSPAGKKVTGHYSGTLHRSVGAGPDTYAVSGDFTLVLQ